MPRALQKPDALLAGHPLVGQQQTDFVGMLFQQLEAFLGGQGGEHAEFVAECAGETLQRFFLVIHVKDGVLPVIIGIIHYSNRRSFVACGWEIPA